jgi:hypothetical protein
MHDGSRPIYGGLQRVAIRGDPLPVIHGLAGDLNMELPPVCAGSKAESLVKERPWKAPLRRNDAGVAEQGRMHADTYLCPLCGVSRS